MKLYFLFPFAILLSCKSVKNANNSTSAEILFTDVKTLSSDQYQGRKTGTPGAEMARAYIKRRLKQVGVTYIPSLNNYEQQFEIRDSLGKTTVGKNILAYIPGKSDDCIVISAHYDHLGIINNEIYNGADDNASGVAGLLKIATYYAAHKPNTTMVFAFFDAGELGWKGSKAFVNNPPLSLEKIKLNINLDMISHNDKGILYVAGTFKNPELTKYINHSNAELKILPGHDNPKQGVDDWTNQSDQGAFNAKDIPYLYFGVEDHKDYHKATDEIENINGPFLVNAANSILEIVENIDQQKDIQKMFRKSQIMK
jgi:Zn-dependent M28 family amino/carboxypeptidase